MRIENSDSDCDGLDNSPIVKLTEEQILEKLVKDECPKCGSLGGISPPTIKHHREGNFVEINCIYCSYKYFPPLDRLDISPLKKEKF